MEPHATPQDETGVLRGYIAEFETPGQLIDAAREVREAGYARWDSHSPFPVHGIDSAMGIRMTILPWIVMAAGVTGCLTGLGLQWYANAVDSEAIGFIPTFLQGYNYLVSGKPYFSLPANIPVIFELTILFSALAAVFGMLVLNNLPWLYNPVFNSERFRRVTEDRFFISIDGRDPKFDASGTETFLASLGGLGVEGVIEFPSPAQPPLILRRVGLLATLVLLIPPAFIYKAWFAKTDKPRIHIVQDMDNQEKFRAQHATALFADHRAMRPPIDGTVARGEMNDDPHYNTGIVDNAFAPAMPLHKITVDAKLLQRGRERFNIYCAPCHGRTADGQGTVNIRGTQRGGGWVAPANLHDDQYRARPVGHIFNTISEGIRTMPPYGDIIPTEDRWAIVAYVRALQRSHYSTIDDVRPELRNSLRELTPLQPAEQE
jgi:mono/diheme cytochrome c family protein